LRKTILVTGGAGYIGSHVCKALYQRGYQPVVYDNLSHGNSWSVQWGPFVEGNLHDEAGISATIEHYGPIAVIHLAASIHAREASSSPGHYYYNNLEGSRILLQTMLENGLGSVVFASTAAVYGNPVRLPIDEDHPKAPLNAYGKSKWAVEELLEDFENAHGLHYAALRIFNACGADPEGAIGEAHPFETHLIPLAIKAALHNSPLIINGDGSTLRDYVHVTDIAEAHVLALEHLLQEKGSVRLNIGSGQGHSILQILEGIEEMTKSKVPYEMRPAIQEEAAALIADIHKARTILGWQPSHSHLSTILQTAFAWHEEEVCS
jgi:UDP-arabinose 4-epimerase